MEVRLVRYDVRLVDERRHRAEVGRASLMAMAAAYPNLDFSRDTGMRLPVFA
jgi:hypothetical protein